MKNLKSASFILPLLFLFLAGRDSSLTARCFNDNGVALMERYSGLAVRPVCD